MTHRVIGQRGATVRKYDFVMPSALQGAGSIIDIAGTAEFSNYRTHRSAEASDAKGLKSDWQAVGDHLRRALDNEGDRPTKP